MAKKHELLGKETKVTFKHWKASGSTYRRHTKSGFKGSKWEGHHVVPGTSMEQSLENFLKDKHEGYPKALANITNWDLNKEYNLGIEVLSFKEILCKTMVIPDKFKPLESAGNG